MPEQVAGRPEFTMVVADVFAFEDGRTVFAGEITTGPGFIPACDCELLIAGVAVARFRIEGEMIPLKRSRRDLRSVSTSEKVDVGLIRYSKGQCTLHSV